jgi:hypothetical protein
MRRRFLWLRAQVRRGAVFSRLGWPLVGQLRLQRRAFEARAIAKRAAPVPVLGLAARSAAKCQSHMCASKAPPTA